MAGSVGTDGAGIGQRRGGDAADGDQNSEWLGAERKQNFYNQWDIRRLRASARSDGQRERDARRDFCVRSGKGHEGFSAWEKREQTGATCERYGGPAV